jgi:carbonic anhydrase
MPIKRGILYQQGREQGQEQARIREAKQARIREAQQQRQQREEEIARDAREEGILYQQGQEQARIREAEQQAILKKLAEQDLCIRSPINIITKSAKLSTNKQLHFNYSAGDCESLHSMEGSDSVKLIYANANSVIYKKNTYNLKMIQLFKNSLHPIDGKIFAGELVLMHTGNNSLLFICIPLSLTTDITKSSFGTILNKLPSTVLSFQSPKKFIPMGDYYSYTGTHIDECTPTEYIVFSSAINITPAEISQIRINNYKQRDTGIVIYSHTKNSRNNAVSFGDDNIFIDCQSVDAPDSVATSATPPAPVDSINFSNLQNSGVVQMLLMFIIFMIVMVIFFYSYEFTTGMFRELTKSVAKMNTAL